MKECASAPENNKNLFSVADIVACIVSYIHWGRRLGIIVFFLSIYLFFITIWFYQSWPSDTGGETCCCAQIARWEHKLHTLGAATNTTKPELTHRNASTVVMQEPINDWKNQRQGVNWAHCFLLLVVYCTYHNVKGSFWYTLLFHRQCRRLFQALWYQCIWYYCKLNTTEPSFCDAALHHEDSWWPVHHQVNLSLDWYVAVWKKKNYPSALTQSQFSISLIYFSICKPSLRGNFSLHPTHNYFFSFVFSYKLSCSLIKISSFLNRLLCLSTWPSIICCSSLPSF